MKKYMVGFVITFVAILLILDPSNFEQRIVSVIVSAIAGFLMAVAIAEAENE